MNWEIQILQYLESIRNPFLSAVMEAITALSEQRFLVVVLSILYWCVSKKKARKMAWIVLINTVANQLIKNTVKALRPFEVGVVLPLRPQTAMGYAFPSGHAQTATAFWGSAIALLKTKSIAIVGSIFILLTAFTRLYLGVHWPKDVIVGILMGILFVIIGDKLLDEEKGFTDKHVLIISCLVVICLIFNVNHSMLSAVSGLWGLVVGGYIEQKMIRFKEKASLSMQITKIVIGLAGVVFLYWGVGKIVPADTFEDMLKNIVVMLWVIAGAPFIFKKFLVKQ
jgi:hypothetical protein